MHLIWRQFFNGYGRLKSYQSHSQFLSYEKVASPWIKIKWFHVISSWAYQCISISGHFECRNKSTEFSDNLIRYVPASCLYGLAMIKTLNLDDNRITSMDDNSMSRDGQSVSPWQPTSITTLPLLHEDCIPHIERKLSSVQPTFMLVTNVAVKLNAVFIRFFAQPLRFWMDL